MNAVKETSKFMGIMLIAVLMVSPAHLEDTYKPVIPIEQAPSWRAFEMNARCFATADFNADGAMDLIIADNRDDHRIYYNHGEGLNLFPGWQPLDSGLDFYTVSLSHGQSELAIIEEFIWPGRCGQALGLRFIAAMLEPDTNNVIGDPDICYFGFN